MRLPVLPLLALLLGLAVGFLLGRSRPHEGRVGRPAPRPMATAPSEETVRRPALAEALRTLPPPVLPTGRGRITGTILREDSTPVPGVTVRATLRRDSDFGRHADGLPEDATLEEEITRLVERLRFERGTRRDAVSAADGGYVLDELVESSRYMLAAYAEGFEFEAQPPPLAWEARPGSVVDFVAKPVCRVTVLIRRPDGTSPESATVSFATPDGRSSHGRGWTAADPEMRIPPGLHRVSAEIPGELAYRCETVDIEAVEGRAPATVVLQMVATPGIHGTARLPQGDVAGRLEVHCQRLQPGQDAETVAVQTDGRSAWLHEFRGYTYAFPDLPAGGYLLALALQDDVILARRAVVVGNDMVRCDLAVAAYDPSRFVAVRVLDPDGGPVTNATFGTAFRTPTRSSSGPGASIRRGDGSYLVAHYPGASSEGSCSIEIRSDRFGTKTIPYVYGETHAVEVHFGEPAHVEVTLAGYAAHPRADRFSVGLRDTGEDGRAWHQTLAVAKERVVLGPVVPGDYELVLYAGSQHVPAAVLPLSLGSGTSRTTVPLPPLHVLNVRVPGGRIGVSLHLRLQVAEGSARVLRASTGADGRATFDDLPAGDYELSSGDRRGGTVRVAVPHAGEVVFDPANR